MAHSTNSLRAIGLHWIVGVYDFLVPQQKKARKQQCFQASRPSLLHAYIALIPFQVDAKCRTIRVVWANSGVTSLVYSSCDANRFYRNSA